MSTRRRGKGRMGGVQNRQVRPIQLRRAPKGQTTVISTIPPTVLRIPPPKITKPVEKQVIKELIKAPVELKEAVQAAVNVAPNNPKVKKFRNIVAKANKMEARILKKILKKESELKTLKDLLQKCKNCH